MDLPDLLDSGRISCHCDIQSKKRALQTVAELLGEAIRTPDGELSDDTADATADATLEGDENELSDMDVLDALIGRERLGSTGLGHGVALPHSRLANIEKPLAALITLNDGVDFDAVDGEPVDLVLGLLVPQECNDEHLKILASLARRFSDAELRAALRSFSSADDLLEHLKSTSPLEKSAPAAASQDTSDQETATQEASAQATATKGTATQGTSTQETSSQGTPLQRPLPNLRTSWPSPGYQAPVEDIANSPAHPVLNVAPGCWGH